MLKERAYSAPLITTDSGTLREKAFHLPNASNCSPAHTEICFLCDGYGKYYAGLTRKECERCSILETNLTYDEVKLEPGIEPGWVRRQPQPSRDMFGSIHPIWFGEMSMLHDFYQAIMCPLTVTHLKNLNRYVIVTLVKKYCFNFREVVHMLGVFIWRDTSRPSNAQSDISNITQSVKSLLCVAKERKEDSRMLDHAAEVSVTGRHIALSSRLSQLRIEVEKEIRIDSLQELAEFRIPDCDTQTLFNKAIVLLLDRIDESDYSDPVFRSSLFEFVDITSQCTKWFGSSVTAYLENYSEKTTRHDLESLETQTKLIRSQAFLSEDGERLPDVFRKWQYTQESDSDGDDLKIILHARIKPDLIIVSSDDD